MPLTPSSQLCDVIGVDACVNTSSADEIHRLMKRGLREALITLMTMLFIVLPPAYANGGHMHLGGVFFLLLGGLLFVGGLGVVFYLLFRAESEPKERDDERENGAPPRRQQP
jgi:hypothetical protein